MNESATIIVLNPIEQELAKRSAKAMHDNKKHNGNFRATTGNKKSHLFYAILGIAGEIAVHKYLYLPWEFQLYKVRDKGDLNLARHCIDVKTAPQRGDFGAQWLDVPVWHTESSEKQFINGYILVSHRGGPKFEIVGYADRPTVFDEPWEKHIYPGHEQNPVWRINRRNLEPASFLRSLL